MSDQDTQFFEQVGTRARPAGSRTELQAETAGRLPQPTPGLGHIDIGAGQSWASSGDYYWRIGQSYDALPPGMYRCEVTDRGPTFIRAKNDTDQLITFPDSESQRILDEIRLFQGMQERFAEHGFLHKRGVLMWGPPGSGKTTTLQLLIRLIVDEHSGVAIIIERPSAAVSCLQMLRAVEPDRQIIGVLEDLDALVERYGESEYLALLDGESQVDRVVYVATTNYPERLDRRFVDRPSRFDTIRYIGMPSAAARRAYFVAKLIKSTEQTVREYVEASDGYSVAHMRELIILTACFGVPLAEAKARLDKTRNKHPSSAQPPDKLGFGFSIDHT